MGHCFPDCIVAGILRVEVAQAVKRFCDDWAAIKAAISTPNPDLLPEAFLMSRGWKRIGESYQDHRQITWWSLNGREFPQHVALGLERLGWRRILDA